jgi:hypothetical protein
MSIGLGPTLLTAQQLATALGLSAPQLLAMARNGTIPSVRINPRVIKFIHLDVLAALRGQPTSPAAVA